MKIIIDTNLWISFLLGKRLSVTVQADYILTGDKDLLTLQFHNQVKIVSYNDFVPFIEY